MRAIPALVTAVAVATLGFGPAPAQAGANSPMPRTVATTDRSGPPAWTRCRNPHARHSIGYPRSWHTAQVRPSEVCRQFDPRPFTVPPNSEYPMTALNAVPTDSSVAAYVAGATDPIFAVTLQVRRTKVGPYRAVRFETVATGEGLHPEGTRTYGYVVDRAGRAFVVFTTTAPRDSRYRTFTRIVDRSVRTLRFG